MCALLLQHTAADILICFCWAGLLLCNPFRADYTPCLYHSPQVPIEIFSQWQKRGILFDSVYLPHTAVCSSRKIESTHRWNLPDNCYFSTFIFLCRIYIQATGKRKGSTIEVITQGSQLLTSNHDRKSVSSFLLYSCLPLRLSAEAFSRQATAAAEHS